jgi:Flavodoxin
MRALLVYESMYGNTRTVARRVADGLRPVFEVDVVPVREATAEMVSAADVLVCGAPTHAHGMSRTSTRQAAVAAVTKKASDLSLDPSAKGPGLRDWLKELGAHVSTPAAAFDTRIDAPSALTGRASRGIARRLRQHGFRLLVGPESFLVDKANHLCDGELTRAERWGAGLASLATVSAEPAHRT